MILILIECAGNAQFWYKCHQEKCGEHKNENKQHTHTHTHTHTHKRGGGGGLTGKTEENRREEIYLSTVSAQTDTIIL